MIALWYGILAFMLTTYIVLDGRNFGVGVLHWIVARNQQERRQVIAAIGPLWSWHEVWLVGTGGVMVMAFPRLMSASFSGCYLALMLILWCLLLRGISIEVGGHMPDRLWQEFWDAVFVFSNVLLSVLFGAAFGNVARGVPLTTDGTFYLPFFTNFGITGTVGLLDWYTVPIALFCVLILAAHGATYLTMKTTGTVHERSVKFSSQTLGRSGSCFYHHHHTDLGCTPGIIGRDCGPSVVLGNAHHRRGKRLGTCDRSALRARTPGCAGL